MALSHPSELSELLNWFSDLGVIPENCHDIFKQALENTLLNKIPIAGTHGGITYSLTAPMDCPFTTHVEWINISPTVPDFVIALAIYGTDGEIGVPIPETASAPPPEIEPYLFSSSVYLLGWDTSNNLWGVVVYQFDEDWSQYGFTTIDPPFIVDISSIHPESDENCSDSD